MSWTNDDSFGGMWDSGEFLSPDLIISPIRQLIKRDAQRNGIDLRNPRRILAAATGSAFMGTALGSFLGPVGAMLGSLLGYAVGIGAKYPEDDEDIRDHAQYLLKLKALSMAVEATKEHTTPKTWKKVNDSVNKTIDRLERADPDLSATSRNFDLVIGSLIDAIRDVDDDVYENFMQVYNTAKNELRL